MRLKAQAGWNQLESDWRRLLQMQPEGCFVALLDGVAVGTTVAVIFGPVAWIAMVLVDEKVRSQGVGRAMMQHALAFLDGEGVPTVRLDATPLGQPLYEKLGFQVEYSLARYEGVLPAGQVVTEPRDVQISPGRPDHYDAILAVDRSITATDRRKLLLRLFLEKPAWLRVAERAGTVEGFLTCRQGVQAVQVGPCMASLAAGPALLADAAGRLAGQRVYIDVPAGNVPANRLAETLGLKFQRPLVRMWRGTKIEEDFTRLWASFGPELG
jgi:hypothetical protein